jgi:hypothetical protein
MARASRSTRPHVVSASSEDPADEREAINDASAIFRAAGLVGANVEPHRAERTQTVDAAIALLHRRQLALLDEPTTSARRAVARARVANGARNGRPIHHGCVIDPLLARHRSARRARRVHRSRPPRRPGSVCELVRRYGSSALELSVEHAVPAGVRVANAVVADTTVRIPTDDPSNLALAPLRRSSRSASVSSGWGCDHRAVPHRAAGERVRILGHGDVRLDRRRVRVALRGAAVIEVARLRFDETKAGLA